MWRKAGRNRKELDTEVGRTRVSTMFKRDGLIRLSLTGESWSGKSGDTEGRANPVRVRPVTLEVYLCTTGLGRSEDVHRHSSFTFYRHPSSSRTLLARRLSSDSPEGPYRSVILDGGHPNSRSEIRNTSFVGPAPRHSLSFYPERVDVSHEDPCARVSVVYKMQCRDPKVPESVGCPEWYFHFTCWGLQCDRSTAVRCVRF